MDLTPVLENMFGYLFAKSMEMDYCQRKVDTESNDTSPLSYDVKDGLAGILVTNLPSELHSLAETAMDYGKQFEKDFSFWCHGVPWDDEYKRELEESLVFVQQIGEIYAKNRFAVD